LNDAVKKADNRNSIDLNFMSRRHKTEKKWNVCSKSFNTLPITYN
jgi:hypothetical protein